MLALAAEASLAAVADAGLSPDDVDGIVRCDYDAVRHNDLAHTLGLRRLDYFSDVGPGGVAPCAMVGQAVAAILSGQATTVLVFRSLNGRSGRRFGLSPVTQQRVGGSGTYDEFFLPYGLLTPGQIFGLLAQRHMLESRDQRKGPRPHRRRLAGTGPTPTHEAQMHDRQLTMDDYLAARMISRPLRLYDFCLETDGAAAVVVTSTERARDLAKPPALIRAVAQGSVVTPQPGIQFPVADARDLTDTPRQADGRHALPPSRPRTTDIDVAQFYDCFTITVLLQLEDYGFCAKGEGGAFVSSGEIDLGGSLPINTGGGHLSEGYIHGMNHIVEGVRQIRGESTSQVSGAEACLVTSHTAAPRQRPDPARRCMTDTDTDTAAETTARRILPVEDDRDSRPASSKPPGAASWPCACATDAAPCCTSPAPTATPCGSWDGHLAPPCGAPVDLVPGPLAEHQVHPAYVVPYTIVLVELDDPGVRFVGYLPGAPELIDGQPMRGGSSSATAPCCRNGHRAETPVETMRATVTPRSQHLVLDPSARQQEGRARRREMPQESRGPPGTSIGELQAAGRQRARSRTLARRRHDIRRLASTKGTMMEEQSDTEDTVHPHERWRKRLLGAA